MSTRVLTTSNNQRIKYKNKAMVISEINVGMLLAASAFP
jgi:hypothetical protein